MMHGAYNVKQTPHSFCSTMKVCYISVDNSAVSIADTLSIQNPFMVPLLRVVFGV